MIEMGKSYRTRDGREVRIYATDGAGEYCVHGAVWRRGGWEDDTWTVDGASVDRNAISADDLIEADPHGILPRHRELLAAEIIAIQKVLGSSYEVKTAPFIELPMHYQAALIALAKQDQEKTA